MTGVLGRQGSTGVDRGRQAGGTRAQGYRGRQGSGRVSGTGSEQGRGSGESDCAKRLVSSLRPQRRQNPLPDTQRRPACLDPMIRGFRARKVRGHRLGRRSHQSDEQSTRVGKPSMCIVVWGGNQKYAWMRLIQCILTVFMSTNLTVVDNDFEP